MSKKALTLIMSAITALLLGSAPAQAQSREISGSVVDFETGETLIGVGISLKGSTTGAITELDGTFKIEVPERNAVLVFSYIGYEEQEIKIEKSEKLLVRMHQKINTLNDAVVVGYGTTARKDLTGSVASVNIADIARTADTNFEESIAGKVAGVSITSNDGQPGSELNIVIRGNNSVTQSNAPLYVIDGFPTEDSMGNVINSDDIESIDILKDASATAIYGARGANGVVLISTKQGKTSKPTFSYKSWYGINQVAKKMDLLTPYEFVRYQLELDPSLSSYYISSEKTLDYYKNAEAIDWQEHAYRNAFVMNHNFSIRGGNKDIRYSVSGLVADQNGTMINSGFNKYQGRAQLTVNLSKSLQFNLNLNYTEHKKYGFVVADNANANYSTSSIMYGLWGYRIVAGARSQQDLLHELFDNFIDYDQDQRVNPIMTLKNTHNPNSVKTMIANAYLQWKIRDNLVLKVRGGYQKIFQKTETFNNSNTGSGNSRTNAKVNGSVYNHERGYFSNENTLTWKKDIGKNRLTTVVGEAYNLSLYSLNGFYATNIKNEELGIAGLDEGTLTSARTTKTENRLLSFFGRIEYNYDSRYLLTATFRADGSSKFPKGNRWGYFPSVAAAWSFGEEKFMKRLPWLSEGKLRVGYGATGNNRISDYGAMTSLEINSGSGYGGHQGLVPMNLGNDALKWETTYQTNAGIDLSFFGERLALTVDWYYKKTDDLLINATIAPSTGFMNGYKNVGSVSNTGLEFTLKTRNIANRHFLWTTDFNISFNKNKVLALNEGESSMTTVLNWGSYNFTAPYIAMVGQPIALFYGYLYDGLYQTGDFDGAEGSYILKDGIPNNGEARENIKPGHIKYKDINGDGKVDGNDLTVIGNPNPIFTGGFTNYLKYKDFDLNIFFQFSYGNQIMNANRLEFEGATGRKHLNQFATVADRWSPTNTDATIPIAGGGGPKVYTDRIIEDGSYLRLKSLSFGYTLPKRPLKKAHINALRFFVTCQNLFTITKYSGSDPEVSTYQSALTPSFDWSSYPRPRAYTAGFEITF